MLRFTWSEAKRAYNLFDKKFDFADPAVEELFTNGTLIVAMDRRSPQYGETRFIGVGYMRGRLVSVVYHPRGKSGETIHLISLRKANSRERKAYQKAQIKGH